MARERLVDIIEKKIDKTDKKGNYIIIYDFYKDKRSKIPQRFYKHIYQLFSKRGDCYFIQKSVILCETLKSAKMLKEIIYHYGGDVLLYEICNID